MADTTVKTVEHGEASEMPEVSWEWRRFYVYAVTLGLLALTYWIVGKINDVSTLRMVARYCLWGVGLAMMLYVAGSTSTDITQLVAALRSTRKETTTTAPPPADVKTETTNGQTSTSVATPGGAGTTGSGDSGAAGRLPVEPGIPSGAVDVPTPGVPATPPTADGLGREAQ